MNSVYVVTHQNLIYACDCSGDNSDYDDYERWSEAFSVGGVFKSEAAAKKFIITDSVGGFVDKRDKRAETGDLEGFDESERDMIEHDREYHYFIEKMDVRS